MSVAAFVGRIGRLKSMSWERALSVALEATSTTGDSPTTSTLSVMPPTPRTITMSATLPRPTTTLSWRFGRKPERLAVTE
jgi:superfamily II DNA/RNA helicase